MFGFNSKNRKIETLLRQSRQDFGFDSISTKARIMLAVNVRHLSKDDVRHFSLNPRTWPKYAFGASLAMLVVVSTTGLAFASTKSKPGEVLFPVQKLQNRVVLSLPLPAATKAQIGTKIAAKRLRELDEIQKHPTNKPSMLSAEIREAQESIAQAAALVPDNETEETDKITSDLEGLSVQHQQALQNLRAAANDDDLKLELENSVKDATITQEKIRSLKHRKGSDNQNPQNEGRTSGSGKLKLRLQKDE
ncbi:MAG: hypothetical protein KW788_03935 [Candidatus Doudnabacteria bacterium]|nr:hypothetical protein [Candidatus Doudnabacteria bacterium]